MRQTYGECAHLYIHMPEPIGGVLCLFMGQLFIVFVRFGLCVIKSGWQWVFKRL